jgi:serine/threonine-protein kinase
MGTVHLAFDHLILREVALKTLREDLSESEDLQRHFIEEAQLTGQLDHPNIVPVYELTTSSDGVAPSVIMRYVDGETYSELVERLHASPTDAQLHETLQVFLKVCDAMSFAHERGVIHCDLKPENITVGKHGQVYVMDWGVAFLQEGEQLLPRGTGPDGTSLRSRGLRHSPLGGTLGYMAPEQLTGDRSVINATTDVYGLGGILCVLLTGKPPRTEASAVADWYQTPRLEDRKAMAEVPPELCRIAERALSPAQADRFQSVDELKYEMEAFMAGGGWFATRHYLAGDVIIREGDSGAEAFIISSGVCDVFRGKLEGPRQFIRSMGPGDTFGELSVLTRKPRSASVVAQTDVSLRLVTVDALDRELKRNPVLASFMSAVTSRFCDLEARLDASQE